MSDQAELLPGTRIEELRGGALAVRGTSDGNRRTRLYRRTRAGRRQLGEPEARWHRWVDSMAAVLTATPLEI